MRKNLGRKIKNKLDFVRSIIWIIFFFFGRKDCFCFFCFLLVGSNCFKMWIFLLFKYVCFIVELNIYVM